MNGVIHGQPSGRRREGVAFLSDEEDILRLHTTNASE